MNTEQSNSQAEVESFAPLAGLLAILIPGAGHLYMKEPGRAFFVAVGVLGLFFGGIFIGGIDVVDRKEDFVWFLGQAMVGPIAFGVDSIHQNHFKARGSRDQVYRSGYPNETRQVIKDPTTGQSIAIWEPRLDSDPGPPNTKSIGKVNEIGTLYAAMAGLLNFIAVLDALFPRRPAGGRRK